MTTRNAHRTVMVKQLPEDLSARQRRIFLKEVMDCMQVDCPRLVLDCASLRRMDKPVIYLLLCCLEEAMKRNGDVKLAAVSSAAGAILVQAGVNRLFEIFHTPAEAINSFSPFVTDALPQNSASELSHLGTENAT